MEVVNTTSTIDPVNMYNYFNNFMINPIVLVIFLLVIVAFFVFSSSLNNDAIGLGNDSGPTGSNIMGYIIVAILIILVLINAFQYFFSINVTAFIQGLFSPTTQLDIVVDQSTYQTQSSPVPEILFKKQVFNIPGNYYNYDDAKAVCSAYGSDLATYSQVEKAYNNGAEWCNYGWSANQLALFPTQKQTYNHLQTIDGHENDCGRPGINGGYIANPNVKFGVNCYGYKPKITPEEDELMRTTSPFPETAKDIDFQNRVDFWKTKVNDILVSPFNHNSWGAF